ncbi:MAG: DnaA regulatory inactivator Hda [Pseudomonadota bacterium]
MVASTQPGRQLTLGVRLRDDAALESFVATEAQAALLSTLKALCFGRGEEVVFLHGPPDSGKSHLLQACCRARGDALYLPLGEVLKYAPDEALAGLEQAPLLCLDDLQSIAGERRWESGLFDLFNRCRDRGTRMLMAADRAPRQLGLSLADLASRLSWGPVFRLPVLSDEQREAVLVERASRRGLQLPSEVARFIVTRAPRGLTDLLALLEVLDQASLEHQRALSIPFVKATLDW